MLHLSGLMANSKKGKKYASTMTHIDHAQVLHNRLCSPFDELSSGSGYKQYTIQTYDKGHEHVKGSDKDQVLFSQRDLI